MPESILRSFVDTANNYIWSFPSTFPWMVALLLVTGIFITFRMKWINIREFRHAVNVIRGKYDNPDDAGDINHFQALATALSATIGIGNIAGVALAIHYAGPGVLLWLWISGLFGMTLKYTECTLSLHFRKFDEQGRVSGGPMYYIERGLGPQWKWMAWMFASLAIVSSFGIGCMNQSNTVAVSAASEFGVPGWMIGLLLAILVGLVILGGIKRIAAVSSRLMPTMAVIYIMGALTILVSNIEQLPGVFLSIVTEAAKPKAAFGGTAAGVWHLTMMWGIKRALFSNEAGMGSAPIAHAAAKTKEPVREGVVAMLGPFVDTMMICTLTGLVILITGVWDEKKPDQVPLDLNKVEVLQAKISDFYGSEDEHEKIAAMIPFQGKREVVNGKTNLVYIVNDAIVEMPRLFKNGRPYIGTIHIQDQKLTGETGQTLHLDLHGHMLQNSSALTALAFHEGFGRFGSLGNLIVTICVFLFALSTMISWSYYGDRCVEYLAGARVVIVYRIVYVIFVYLGAILALETVWAYGDMALGLMTVPNLIAVLLLSPKVVELGREYFKESRNQEIRIKRQEIRIKK
ncbi:sodium:alanine symporter family protein [bacterium]|nr:sodium:alanine symporter family protein [bacterium]